MKVITNLEPLQVDESDTESSHNQSTPIFNSDQSIFGMPGIKESSLEHDLEEDVETLQKLQETTERDLTIFSS